MWKASLLQRMWCYCTMDLLYCYIWCVVSGEEWSRRATNIIQLHMPPWSCRTRSWQASSRVLAGSKWRSTVQHRIQTRKEGGLNSLQSEWLCKSRCDQHATSSGFLCHHSWVACIITLSDYCISNLIICQVEAHESSETFNTDLGIMSMNGKEHPATWTMSEWVRVVKDAIRACQ